MDDSNEKVLWQANPSQWVAVRGDGMAVLVAAAAIVGAVYVHPWCLALLALAAAVGLYYYLTIRSTGYRLTTQRLVMVSGILTRRTEEVELYRVKDSQLLQPLSLRLVGLGNIVLRTSDITTPVVVLHAIPQAETARQLIREQVEHIRQTKGVHEIDILSDSSRSAKP